MRRPRRRANIFFQRDREAAHITAIKKLLDHIMERLRVGLFKDAVVYSHP
jgi:hypothetical protein